MNNTPADAPSLSSSDLRRIVYSRFAIALVVLPLFFFVPAGTVRYWEAWVYLAILLIPVFFVMRYLLKHDPAFLERRMRMREREKPQRLVITLSFLWFFLVFILPGFDQRFGWSDVPVAAVLAADLLVLLGYGVILRVFRENRYASRVVEVDGRSAGDPDRALRHHPPPDVPRGGDDVPCHAGRVGVMVGPAARAAHRADPGVAHPE